MKVIKQVAIALMLGLAMASCASSGQAIKSQASAETIGVDAAPFEVADYAEVLSRYVNTDGLVNYQSLQGERQKLDAFNTSIGAVSTARYESWTERRKIAFLINAYNALTLQSIIDQKPLKSSIKDIPGVWNGRRFQVVGEAKTLDNIEHEMLRKQFNEPRIHMALVCAALSCPFLRDEPYEDDRLNEQLDDQAKRFLASPTKGFRIDRSENRVYLSSIFKWYGDDWKKKYGVETGFSGSAKERAVLNFISLYVGDEDRAYLKKGGYEVRYLDYDWALNQQ